jgi:predicted kinase
MPGDGGAVSALREKVSAGHCLIMLLGPAGSGKSSLASQIADGGQVLSLDALRAAVFSGDECDQDATPDAVAVLHLLAAARLRRRLSTVIDATYAETSARAPLLDIACSSSVPTVAAVMTTPLHKCLARNAGRPGRRRGRRVPDQVIRAQYGLLRQSLQALRAEGFTAVMYA